MHIEKKFGFSKYYGMNWDAFKDHMWDVKLPKKLVFLKWDNLTKILPHDTDILKRILSESHFSLMQVFYN